MIRSYRYPLRPTVAQEAILYSWLSMCCALYNAALEERQAAWRNQRISISLNHQEKELTGLRVADPEWKAFPTWVARSALVRLNHAFRGFFRRVKLKQTPGYPRFRSVDRYRSFDLGSNPVSIEGDRVRLPKIGFVKFHKYREIRGEVKQVSISRTARGWSISFVCDVGNAPEKIPTRAVVGLDVGLESFATLSNGERFENPRFFRESEKVLSRRQGLFVRKQKGSASRKEAKRLVGRIHERIHNQRLDFVRKLASTLFSRFDLIVHEDLQISRMVHGNLAKSIRDAGWGMFLRCLALKAEEAGRHVIAVDPIYTSQTCAACGTVAKKTLDERQHACSSCGFSAHRDHNAALVILGRGLRLERLTEAECGRA